MERRRLGLRVHRIHLTPVLKTIITTSLLKVRKRKFPMRLISYLNWFINFRFCTKEIRRSRVVWEPITLAEAYGVSRVDNSTWTSQSKSLVLVLDVTLNINCILSTNVYSVDRPTKTLWNDSKLEIDVQQPFIEPITMSRLREFPFRSVVLKKSPDYWFREWNKKSESVIDKWPPSHLIFPLWNIFPQPTIHTQTKGFRRKPV